ncbi:hypothetical protein [Chryseobacterium bernardetii]|uniref:hypothetical protein n=1 Tax=Chryseobacterium bernardetii TaxID=1241978 RepID=UPI00162AE707|nr:hypothetical protein [Chryseobacterium bernardetii]
MAEGVTEKRMLKYIKKRGWETFRSPNYWIHPLIMDDITLDNGGVNLKQAYDIQVKLELKNSRNE